MATEAEGTDSPSTEEEPDKMPQTVSTGTSHWQRKTSDMPGKAKPRERSAKPWERSTKRLLSRQRLSTLSEPRLEDGAVLGARDDEGRVGRTEAADDLHQAAPGCTTTPGPQGLQLRLSCPLASWQANAWTSRPTAKPLLPMPAGKATCTGTPSPCHASAAWQH